MKKIKLGALEAGTFTKDGKVEEVKIDTKDVLATALTFAAMKSVGDRVTAPFFPFYENMEQMRMGQKILRKLDDAEAEVELSEEQFTLLKRVLTANIYMSTRQAAVWDRVDGAEDIEK